MGLSKDRLSRPKIVRKQKIGDKEKQANRRWATRVLWFVVVVAILSLFLVWVRIKVIQMSYQITELKEKNAELTQKMNEMDLKVAKLKSPQRLEDVARTEIGMHPPGEKENVFVKETDSGGVVVVDPEDKE